MMPDNINQGFRLDYLEVYNWGTFDSDVERIVPGCDTSLLTGANGSGKTTLVDALLTLLVPNNKRFYNQSSGADLKKDRDETSYVLGYYGKSLEEEDTKATPKALRKKSDYSVLLGCFFNPATGQHISLVQVRWFSNTELKRAYIVSPHRLEISKHIAPVDSRGEWRKRLKKEFIKTEVFDTFSGYSDVFRHYFGMRSEKALSLFNLTVGIKVINNLNEFIRVNMLEEGDAEEEFSQLHSNFHTLLDIHRNIQKARLQLEMLQPIVSLSSAYKSLQEKVTQLDWTQEAIKLYYPEQELSLRHDAIAQANRELDNIKEAIQSLQSEITAMTAQKAELEKARDQNDSNIAIRKIEEGIQKETEHLERKQEQEKKYVALIKKLGWDAEVNENTFNDHFKKSAEEEKTISAQLELISKEKVSKAVQQQKAEEEAGRIKEEEESLGKRDSQIPVDNLRIRQGILDAVGAEPHEIPFIGELVRVKPEEKRWEGAIEKLLRNFGLRLLVPDEYVRAVNQYVHETNLRGKVVYQKIDTFRKVDYSLDIPNGSLREKIDIKEGTIFEGWLEWQFSEHYNYICTDDQAEFSKNRKALMSSGLHKNAERHEKDDTSRRSGPESYILGWNNKEKRLALAQRYRELKNTIDRLSGEIEELESRHGKLVDKIGNLRSLKHFTSYSELNWQQHGQRIGELEKNREQLLKKSNELNELIRQIEDIGKKITTKNDKREKLIESRGSTGTKIEEHRKRIGEIESLLEQFSDVDTAGYYQVLKEYIQSTEDKDELKKLEKERKATEQHVKEILKQKQAEEKETRSTLERTMNKFVSPKKDILDKFPDWSTDTLNLTAHADYSEEFEKLFDRIHEDDLPKNQQKFRSYMNEAVLERITSFKTSLDNRKESIEEYIDELNLSLKAIDFSKHPATYIQLKGKPNRDIEIRDFREELRSCLPNVADAALKEQDDWMEKHFMRIRQLLEKLHTDANLRKRVIDVRNWLEFSAEEFNREDNSRANYYESSASLSGGEKAQFTYTILGAAIAYQFGINQDGSQARSFRFIAVDEAFSKLDPEKSNYLMELCRQLHLQLLVVTPLDKIHIAEPYISSCHYVENRNKQRSYVYNLTMEEYYQRKKEFEGAEEVLA